MADNTETDERVVKMTFDNKSFDKNVKETTQSLDKLKTSLNFENVSSGIEEVEIRMSAFDIATTTALVNIAKKVSDLGITFVKSLSVDNIASGWAKYEQKTVALATLIAQKIKIAGNELTNESDKISAINTQLDELNWFADETSYSFTDMVSSISKFTASGQSLDVSTKAIEGIATWAALSGQNATTASSAMYQLAQAMSKGKVELQDYKSIQTANMDTEEFRETILATAVSLGKLTKSGDEFITTTGKKFKTSEFTKYLSEGWFSSDVLISGLNKYSTAVQQIYDIAEKEGITAAEVIEKYGDTLDAFGVKAFKAAQEARTFTDVISSIKDAVSSKWLQTAEYIFGSYSQAVSLFSDLADELYDVFAEGGNFRNEILGVWSDLSGRDDLFKHGGTDQGAFWNIYDSVIDLVNLIKTAWNDIFPKSSLSTESDQVKDIGEELKNITENFKEFTKRIKLSENATEELSNIFKGLFATIKIAIGVLNAAKFALLPVFELIKNIYNSIIEGLSNTGKKLEKFASASNFLQKTAVSIANALQELIEIINPSKIFSDLLSYIGKLIKSFEELDVINKVKSFIEDFVETLRNSGGTEENFSKIVVGTWSALSILGKAIIAIVKIFSKYFVPVLDFITEALLQVVAVVSGIATQIAAIVSDLFTRLNSVLNGSSGFAGFSDEIMNFLNGIPAALKNLEPVFVQFVRILKNLFGVLIEIPKFLDKISIALSGKSIIENFKYLLNAIADSIEEFKNQMTSINLSSSSTSLTPFQVFVKGIITFLKGATTLLGSLLKVVGSALKTIGDVFQMIGEAIQGMFDGKNSATLVKIIAISALILLVVLAIRNIIYAIVSVVSPISEVADSLSGALDSIAAKNYGQTFKKLADSMLEIAASLLVIASINEKDLYRSVAVMAIISVVLFAILKLATKVEDVTVSTGRAAKTIGASIRGILSQIKMDLKATTQMTKLSFVANTLIAFGASMLMVATSLLILKNMSWGDMLKGLASAAVVLGSVVLLSKVSGSINVKGAMPKVLQIIAFAAIFKTLSYALKDISSIPWLSLLASTLSLGALMLSLSLSLKLMEKTLNVKKSLSIMVAMISLSGMILAFVLSLKILSGISWSSLLASAGSLSLLIMVLTASVKILEKGSNIKKSVGVLISLIGLVSIILALTFSIGLLSAIPWQKELIAVGSITVLLAAVTASVKIIEKGNNIKKSCSTLITYISVAGLMYVFALSIAMLSAIPWVSLIASVGSLIALIAAMTASIIILNSNIDIKGSIKVLVLLTAVSMSMYIMAESISILSSIPWQKELIAVGTMIVLIAAYIGMILVIKKLSTGVGSFSKISVMLLGLVMFSATLLMFAETLNILSKINWLSLAVSVGAIILLLTTLSIMPMIISETGIKNLIELSLVLTLLGVAMLPFAAGLSLLSNIPWQVIAIGAVATVASLLLFAGIAKMLTTVVPSILSLAAAVLLIGVGMLAAALSMNIFAAGMLTFSASLVPFAAAIGQVFSTLGPAIVKGIVDSLGTLLDSVTVILPKIEAIVGTAIDAIVDLVKTKGPELAGMVVSLSDNILASLDEHKESIFTHIFNIIKEFLLRLGDSAGDLVKILMDTIVDVIVAITAKVGDLVSAVMDLLKELIKATFDKIEPVIALLVDDTFLLITAILDKITMDSIKFGAEICKIILIMIATGLKLAITLLGTLASYVLTFMTAMMQLALQVFIGMSAVHYEFIRALIANIILAMCKVAENLGPEIIIGLKALASAVWNGFIGAIQEILKGMHLDLVSQQFEGLKIDQQESYAALEELANGTDKMAAAAQEANTKIKALVSNTNDSLQGELKNGLLEIIQSVKDAVDALNLEDLEISVGVGLKSSIPDSSSDSLSSTTGKQSLASGLGNLGSYSGSTTGALASDTYSKAGDSSVVNNTNTTNNNTTNAYDSHDTYYVEATSSDDVDKALSKKHLRKVAALGD